MNKAVAVQVFALLAIVVGLVVSYWPPVQNEAALWALVSGFLGYAVRDLFAEPGKVDGDTPATPPSQSGHVLPALLIPLGVLAALALNGCASLQNAGTAEYSVKPFLDQSGAVHCCEVRVVNGKEIANLKARITKQGDSYSVDLEEQGVTAFQGQAIAAGATQAAIDAAAKAAAAAALAPVLPALLPALAAPGIGSAVVGAGVVLEAQQLLSSPTQGEQKK